MISYNDSDDFQYLWDHEVENKGAYAIQKFQSDHKFRGISLYQLGRNRNLQLNEIIKSNVEWLAVHPYFSQPHESSATVSIIEDVGKWSSKDSMFISEINQAREKGFSVMLKPHLWLSEGWRSDIHFDTEEEWLRWFTAYKNQLLHYALLAEEAGAELFCIGTELRSSVERLPEQWIQFILELKTVYTGRLTYAANWNDPILEMDMRFWQELDFIGIQGYYPVSETSNPELKDIVAGWKKHIVTLEEISRKYGRPILFTEIGYRADKDATVQPWEWYAPWSPLTTKKSTEAQLLAYEGFFQSLWDKEWFVGSFIWQWRSFDFGIQGKPAQNIMTKWYK